MSEQVKRYALQECKHYRNDYDRCDASMEEEPDGNYVLASDYDRLAGLCRKLAKHIGCDYYGLCEENPSCPCPRCKIKADALALIGAGGEGEK